ncbi:hypothetical protein TK90_2666 (plasmid) [Thioalkalivibrio sp. K90mix]|uniref:hypothetical protein n=1 Tax=Thioalkalivibrio sp. (strain K90mix) TaxID=396595 RepID=UPI000195A3B6|nr:hypothetical protein [Thioalkalivibrio sp. K90mix]ADC73153.1 hypothetical protein TK90_2666 [Thioalkalivibrio sp. K90mix]
MSQWIAQARWNDPDQGSDQWRDVGPERDCALRAQQDGQRAITHQDASQLHLELRVVRRRDQQDLPCFVAFPPHRHLLVWNVLGERKAASRDDSPALDLQAR